MEKTLLVLGAGSSMGYGYPSGQGLLLNIWNEFLNRLNAYEESQFEGLGLYPDKISIQKEANEFVSALKEANPPSIDLFLARHSPLYDKIGKIAISLDIHVREEASASNNFNLYFTSRDNWQKILFEKLCSGCTKDSVDELLPWPVDILTFNYDRSFEISYLRYFLANFKNKDSQKLRDALKITHVFGCISESPFEKYGGRAFVKEIVGASNKINVIYDKRDTIINISPDFVEHASSYKRIIFLGFGFDSFNMKIMGVPEIFGKNVEIIGTKKGMTPSSEANAIAILRHLSHDIKLVDESCSGLLNRFL